MPVSPRYVQDIVREVSEMFKVEQPKVVIVDDLPEPGEYYPSTKTIYIRRDVLDDITLARRVAIHEAIHHVDATRGWSMSEDEAEIIAHAFEVAYAYGGTKTYLAARVAAAATLGVIVGVVLGASALKK